MDVLSVLAIGMFWSLLAAFVGYHAGKHDASLGIPTPQGRTRPPRGSPHPKGVPVPQGDPRRGEGVKGGRGKGGKETRWTRKF